jgi:outer membrane protein assembly factor BamE
MHLLPTYSVRFPALAGVIGMIFAVCLAGCATKAPVAPVADANAPATAGVQKIEEGRFLGILSPYRIDIQQGNFISSEIMTQLQDGMKRKEGMTKDQVRFLLGTPLITDVFHGNRWDYVFRLQRNNGEIITSHVSAVFDGNKLSKIDGTNLPTEKDYISLIAGSSASKR